MADFADGPVPGNHLSMAVLNPETTNRIKQRETDRKWSKGVEQFLMFLGWDVLKIEVAFGSFGRRMRMVFLTISDVPLPFLSGVDLGRPPRAAEHPVVQPQDLDLIVLFMWYNVIVISWYYKPYIFWGCIYTYLRAAAPAADPGRIGK